MRKPSIKLPAFSLACAIYVAILWAIGIFWNVYGHEKAPIAMGLTISTLAVFGASRAIKWLKRERTALAAWTLADEARWVAYKRERIERHAKLGLKLTIVTVVVGVPITVIVLAILYPMTAAAVVGAVLGTAYGLGGGGGGRSGFGISIPLPGPFRWGKSF
jgi:hypothetical protein